jgi:hypothetical protein
MDKIYQVLVDYVDPRAGVWRSPMVSHTDALLCYGDECNRISMGGIRRVLLTKHGVVVAQTADT